MTPLRFRILALAACALPLAACDSGTEDVGAKAEVTVISRNLYLGADIFALLDPACAPQVPLCVNDLYADVEASDPAARALALAEEIDEADADLVGLQEVALYRVQEVSDFVTGTTTPNADSVAYDFLALLLDALDARGLDYAVAAQNTNADVELPATADGATFRDVRFTDRDVILARAGVATRGAAARQFAAAAPFVIGADTIAFVRGYSYVTAEVDDVAFTFANAHLEVGGEAVAVQQAQAAELRAGLPAGTTVLVGDFNSDPADAGADGASYRLLTTGDFTDAWVEAGEGTGLTCCQAPDLGNETPTLTSRIDLVLFRGAVEAEDAEVVGDEAADRTAGGLWPSDHAGVVAALRVRASESSD